MARKIRIADNEALFDGMVEAAGVNISPEEKRIYEPHIEL